MSNQELDEAEGATGAAPAPADAPAIATTFQEAPGQRGQRLSKARLTKAALDKQPKVQVYIPETEDELVKINGYTYHLKRGEQVEVPRQVAEMLLAKWKATAKSNKPRQLDLGQL